MDVMNEKDFNEISKSIRLEVEQAHVYSGGVLMRMSEAEKIMAGGEGFMVTFETITSGGLRSDHFPEKESGEELIETEEKAWELAIAFARRTVGKCFNVYVVDQNMKPVLDYHKRILNKLCKSENAN